MSSTLDAPGPPAAPEERAYASVTVPSRVESVRLASAFIVQAARNMRVPPASDPLFELAIVEALNNAVKHGNPGQRPEALIICEVELVEHRLTVRILDQGPGFALPRAEQPQWTPTDVAAIPESGFGTPIIQGVFPVVREIAWPGRFGLEMALSF